MSAVIGLCDLTGNGLRPWIEAGHDAYLVDPQHGFDNESPSGFGGTIYRLAKTVLEALPELARIEDIAFVTGYPPCDDMTVAGARWFADKWMADSVYLAKAVAVAEQCRTFALASRAPFFIENPVGMLAHAFGKPNHTFNPFDYTLLAPEDNYSKRTCLWTGNGFVMPKVQRDKTLGKPDNRIHMAAPGPDRANFRSITPMGFARAVFASNATMRLPTMKGAA